MAIPEGCFVSQNAAQGIQWEVRVDGSRISGEGISPTAGVVKSFAYTAAGSWNSDKSRLDAKVEIMGDNLSTVRSGEVTIEEAAGRFRVRLSADSFPEAVDEFDVKSSSKHLREVLWAPVWHPDLQPSEQRKPIRDGIIKAFGQAKISVNPANGWKLAAGSRTAWTADELRHLIAAQLVATPELSFDPQLTRWLSIQVFVPRYGNDASGNETTFGLMFDTEDGFQRQASAVFWDTLQDAADGDADFETRAIRTAVHEFGHTLNLVHAWEWNLSHIDPAKSTSCMSNPDFYRDGASAYWTKYRAQETVFEGFERNWMCHEHIERVAMGGSDYLGSTEGTDRFSRRPRGVPDHARLEFTLHLSPRNRPALFEFGEPVTLEARLRSRGGKRCSIQDKLDPAHGETTYFIRSPSGKSSEFRPTFRRCDRGRDLDLKPGRSALYEAVTLAYGKDGFYFMEPGQYQIVAWYREGSISVLSKPLSLWIRYPTRTIESAVVPLFDARVGRYLAGWGNYEDDDWISGQAGLLHPRRMNRVHPLLTELNRCRIHLRLRGGRQRFRAAKRTIKFDTVAPQFDERLERLALDTLGLQCVGHEIRRASGANGSTLPTIRYAYLAALLANRLKDEQPDHARQVFQSIEDFNQRYDARQRANSIPKQALQSWKNRAFAD